MVKEVIVQKRTLRRSRTYLPVTLEGDGGREEALVRDISRLGALLEAAVPPPLGSTVRLICEQTIVGGRVVWRDSSWFGIKFVKPLERGTLLDQMRPRLRISAPRAYRRQPVHANDESSQAAE